MYEHIENVPVTLHTMTNELNDIVVRLHGHLQIANTGYVTVHMPANKEQVKKYLPGDSILLTNSIEDNVPKALEFVKTWEFKWNLKNTVSKVMIREYVRHKLSTCDKWSLAALIKIYGFQTANEQACDHTILSNNVGFTGHDAEFLSSIAKQLITRIKEKKEKGYDANPEKCLSQRQKDVIRKTITKYWQQIVDSSDETKLLFQAKHFHESNESRIQTRLPL